MDLLWTNPNPTASFAAQTIPLDLSKYTFVVMVTSDSNGMALVGYTRDTLIVGNNFVNPRSRSFRALTNGVIVSDGYQGTTLTNDNCVPYQIYGMK